MNGINVTLADRRNPIQAVGWSRGQERTSEVLLTAAEMLEVAGLNWTAEKQAMFAANGQPVPGRWANVRSSDGKVIGDVGDRYTNIQPLEAFQFGDTIVDDGKGLWERAGDLRGGSMIFGCMEITESDIHVPGDDGDVKPYLMIINSYDGSSGLEGILAFIRPVCQNTFEMARGTKTQYRFKIRHTSGLEGKVQAARQALGIAYRHIDAAGQLMQQMATTSILDEQVREIFQKAVWPVQESTMDSPALLENHASTLAFENYMTSPTVDPVRGTVWGAFNAVTEFTNHIQSYKSKKQDEASARLDAVLMGIGQERADRFMKAVTPLLK